MTELSEAEEAKGLVEKLVTSGEQTLDQASMKRLKSLCKKSCLEQTFHVLMTQLEKDHSEIRYSTFQIINEFFVRSHMFRTLLLDKFPFFMELTVESDFDNPLPPPKPVAEKLKEESLRAIKDWNDKYGSAYQKLSLGFDYLKNVKKVKFDQPRPASHSLASENRLSRIKIVNGVKLDKLKQEINSSLWEVKCFVVEMNNCLNLIIPNFNESDIENSSEEKQTNEVDISSTETEEESYENVKQTDSLSSLREAGMVERGYVVQLDLAEVASVKVVENIDNQALIERASDLIKSANRIHLPKLREWLTTAGKCGASSELLKDLIDVKTSIKCSLDKYYEMNIYADDEEDCDDFVEVPDDNLALSPEMEKSSSKKNDADTPQNNMVAPKNDTNVWTPLRSEDDLHDPTTYKYALAQQAKLREKSNVECSPQPKKLKKEFLTPKNPTGRSDSDVNTLKNKAPVVRFGRDLLTWDKQKYEELRENLTFGAHRELDVGHRFYGGHSASEADSGASEAALSSITSRTIEFSGEFQPVLRKCRAPLGNGQLCSRQDRHKCPFHGKIIDRDACGRAKGQQSTSTAPSTSDWNDPSFLDDLQANLPPGVKLKKTKGKKKVENGLTDLKKLKNTSRSRLQRKVLNKGSLKRVSETLNHLDAKRNLDKFGNNFNYALH